MVKDQDLQPALDAAQNQLGLTFSDSDSLDTKALAILGFDVAIGIFALQSAMNNSAWLLVPLFATLLLSLFICIACVKPREYVGAIVDLARHPSYFNLDTRALVAQLLADTQKGIAQNTQYNLRKIRYTRLSTLLSLVSTGLLIACIL